MKSSPQASDSEMDASIEDLVRRANGRCEYCRTPQEWDTSRFTSITSWPSNTVGVCALQFSAGLHSYNLQKGPTRRHRSCQPETRTALHPRRHKCTVISLGRPAAQDAQPLAALPSIFSASNLTHRVNLRSLLMELGLFDHA